MCVYVRERERERERERGGGGGGGGETDRQRDREKQTQICAKFLGLIIIEMRVTMKNHLQISGGVKS